VRSDRGCGIGGGILLHAIGDALFLAARRQCVTRSMGFELPRAIRFSIRPSFRNTVDWLIRNALAVSASDLRSATALTMRNSSRDSVHH
jgi:hypothetical protein